MHPFPGCSLRHPRGSTLAAQVRAAAKEPGAGRLMCLCTGPSPRGEQARKVVPQYAEGGKRPSDQRQTSPFPREKAKGSCVSYASFPVVSHRRLPVPGNLPVWEARWQQGWLRPSAEVFSKRQSDEEVDPDLEA